MEPKSALTTFAQPSSFQKALFYGKYLFLHGFTPNLQYNKVPIKQVSEITGQGTLIWSPFCIYILLEMWLGNLVLYFSYNFSLGETTVSNQVISRESERSIPFHCPKSKGTHLSSMNLAIVFSFHPP